MYKGQVVNHRLDGECRFLNPHEPYRMIPARLQKNGLATPPSSPDHSFLLSLTRDDVVPLRKSDENFDQSRDAEPMKETCCLCDDEAVQHVSLFMPNSKSLHNFALCLKHCHMPETNLQSMAVKSDRKSISPRGKCCNCGVRKEQGELMECDYCGQHVFCGEWCKMLTRTIVGGMATHVCVLSKENIVEEEAKRQRSKSNFF